MQYAREPAVISGADPQPGRPRLLDEVRRRLRLKHYSLRTEQAYLYWVRRYIRSNNLRHPREMGGAEVERFLSDLARRDKMAPRVRRDRSRRLFLEAPCHALFDKLKLPTPGDVNHAATRIGAYGLRQRASSSSQRPRARCRCASLTWP